MEKTSYSDISGAQLDFSKAMSYGDYLQLEPLLSCQKPLSESHDELLFITIHQASELWMKLIIHELTQARAYIKSDQLDPAFKMMARVRAIGWQLIQSWEVLSTLTPSDYQSFRGRLGTSSGFQSYQYRAIEFLLGSKDERMLEPHRHRSDLLGPLVQVLESPSLYDESILVLARRGFPIDREHLERDYRSPYSANDSVKKAWLEIYRDTKRWWDLYELAEKLVDLEDWFQLWRYRHMAVVKRVIGQRVGTGGTAGVSYLKQAVGRPLFPELYDVRTEL